MFKRAKKPITVQLAGGTGNQLFMYFAGLALSTATKTTLVLETRFIGKFGTNHGNFLRDLRLNGNLKTSSKDPLYWLYINRIINGLARRFKLIGLAQTKFLRVYNSNEIGFDSKVFELDDGVKLHGYFQTWKYFEYCKNHDLVNLELRNPTEEYMKAVEALIDVPTLVVHVRRGDYIPLSQTFGVLDESYFVTAAAHLLELYGINRIWIFSDEIDVVESNFKDKIWRGAVFTKFDLSPLETIFLMSKASAFVISNSSFSYWAAMLSKETDRTVAPESWFKNLDNPKDLLPPSWTTIKSEWLD